MSERQTFKPAWGIRFAVAVALAVLVGLAHQAVARAQAPGGPREGIKVHGHWTIEIHQPDGTLVGRHDFENGLLNSGKAFLVGALTRTMAVQYWVVKLNQVQGDKICDFAGQPFACYISESGAPDAFASDRLTVTASGTSVVLTGDVVATHAGSIVEVQTGIRTSATSGAQVFTAAGSAAFSAVPVVAGQIIQVTVTISFS